MRCIHVRLMYSLLSKNHSRPNIAANDNWNPAFMIEKGLIKNIIKNAKAALRKDKTPRPKIVAINISVAIKKARVVATLIPDMYRYKISPNQAQTIAGYFAGMRFDIGDIERNIK